MSRDHIQTDSFVVDKHKLRIYRVIESGARSVLWTSEQQAIQYVQRLRINKLVVSEMRQ